MQGCLDYLITTCKAESGESIISWGHAVLAARLILTVVSSVSSPRLEVAPVVVPVPRPEPAASVVLAPVHAVHHSLGVLSIVVSAQDLEVVSCIARVVLVTTYKISTSFEGNCL